MAPAALNRIYKKGQTDDLARISPSSRAKIAMCAVLVLKQFKQKMERHGELILIANLDNNSDRTHN
jgi:hypothetical protein